MTETRYYKKKLTATTTEQSLLFEDLGIRLIKYSVLNVGPQNVLLEPDNSIDGDSILVPAGMSVDFDSDNLSLQYKAESGTATLYLFGTKHSKS